MNLQIASSLGYPNTKTSSPSTPQRLSSSVSAQIVNRTIIDAENSDFLYRNWLRGMAPWI
ncbi:hypothetical protein GGD56_006333 [Rhizobium mongolense]|uniref:Uncharacterized protein n=1 Tax=Rhizobium mongolense TaxID=57676 RepID=A0ABR6IWY6_9HYPH|nr:hypothetical protein [Rhizobium mongolense]